ncbi:competence protein [Erwinia sp. CPCC 100877]|nr:competence protein [Erwinia sp. CPCC 100877]
MKDTCYLQIDRTRKHLSPLGDIRYRALFGGYSLYVDDTVFAMVVGGNLYLRACEQNEGYFLRERLPMLSFSRRGRQISLKYYLVGETLWREPAQLLALSWQALDGARQEKIQRRVITRLKDLPNLTSGLESMLWVVGIQNVEALQVVGAKASWLKLRRINKEIGVKVLLALAGAIYGLHEAALPPQMRQELLEWASEQVGNDVLYSGN